jgi:hypothetical protein
MKKLVLGIIIIAIMGFAAKELITSRKATPQPEASGFKFYYYPKLNIYYDATQNNFVYTVDGGVTWQTKKPSSPDLPERLDQKITIYSPDPDAWINNSQHRQQYKGVTTNYVQRVEDTARFIAAPASLKTDTGLSAQKTGNTTKKTEENKNKSNSWFNRLKEKIKKGLRKNKDQASDSI